MSDRKYRQPGYRGQDSGPRRPEPPRSEPPRSGGVLAQQTVSRCAACGAALPIAAASLVECPDCRAPVHACRQCAHLDTGRRFECVQPIAERIVDKNAPNQCALFSLRVVVERNASPDSARPSDIRRSFENLFKKP
jgi:hypothetical protein